MTAIALTIAGSDSSGGAGIQADLKTFSALGVYGASVITALTAQNTRGVDGIHDVPPEFVARQIDSVFSDLAVNAVKIGMLSQPAIIAAVAAGLDRHGARNVVLDPVMIAASGAALLVPEAVETLRRVLVPKALLVTPNLPEAAALTGRPVSTASEMRDAARALTDMGARAALVKGGHLPDAAVDVLWDGVSFHELTAPRVPGIFHGTGCTLSAAIAVYLARGTQLRDAVAQAKRYVTDAIADSPARGRGARPLDNRSRG